MQGKGTFIFWQGEEEKTVYWRTKRTAEACLAVAACTRQRRFSQPVLVNPWFSGSWDCFHSRELYVQCCFGSRTPVLHWQSHILCSAACACVEDLLPFGLRVSAVVKNPWTLNPGQQLCAPLAGLHRAVVLSSACDVVLLECRRWCWVEWKVCSEQLQILLLE